MPSLPRYLVLTNKSLFHVTWQCHNREFHLQHDWAKKKYYDLLLKYKDKYHIKIFSYCFMSNHPHITGYVDDKKNLSDFFRIVNALFARFYNKIMNRRGQLVMDRFKSPVIETQPDLLKVMYYIDLNPKRARMVKHPKEYAWTSFHHYAYGKNDPLVTHPDCYLNLGESATERQNTYLSMIEEILKNDWKEKKKYSSECFIGNPEWVTMRYIQLRQNIRERQHFKKMQTTHPPT